VGLTSKKLIVLCALIAFIVIITTVWLWPRLAQPKKRMIAARLGVLLLGQVSILVTLALVANLYFSFYSSFDDLFGRNNATPKLSDKGKAAWKPADAITVKGTQPVGTAEGGVPEKAGQIVETEVAGVRSGVSNPAYVYLPPQYFQPEFAQRKFPVVTVLTGYPGDAKYLIDRFKIPVRAAEGMRSGKMRPAIYVMLRPTVAPPRDTECTDVPDGPQAETFLTQDLPEAVAARWRTAPDRESWALLGNSTGGYCALKLAMRNSTKFATAVSLSGYYNAVQDSTTGDLYGGSKAVRDSNNLLWRIKNLPSPPIQVLLASSEQGEPDYPDSMEFAKLAKPPMAVSTLIRDAGGHNFKTWEEQLTPAMEWLSGKMPTG
jgi:enterochelin esterase-like enzyme